MIELVIVLILIGVGLYLVNTIAPMAAPIKTIINVVVVLATLLYVAQKFGLLHGRLGIPG